MTEPQVQDPKTATQDPDPKTVTDPDPNKTTTDEKTFSQSEVDQRVTAAVKKRDADNAVKSQKAAEKAQKDAAEAKLLEDGKLEDLVNIKTKEADEATAQLAKYERDENVDKLLNKHEILEPEFRDLFKATGLDLESLNPLIEGFVEKWNAAVKAEVDKRLSTDPPPKNTNTPPSPGDLDAQIAKAQAEKDWKLSAALKNQKFDSRLGAGT